MRNVQKGIDGVLKGTVNRRTVLKAGAVGLEAAALGALPGRVVAQAPAVLKGTKLAILQGTYFIAPAQDLYKRQAEEWGKQSGVEVSGDAKAAIAWGAEQLKRTYGV